MTEGQALDAVKDAFYRGRYFIAPHAQKRMEQRDISFHDIKAAVMNARRAERYADPSRKTPVGAESWRITGVDLEGKTLVLGIDLVRDHLGTFATVVTVF